MKQTTYFTRISDELVINAYLQATSVVGLIRSLNGRDIGGNRKQLKVRLENLNLSYNDLASKGKEYAKNKLFSSVKTISNELLFRKDSIIGRSIVKNRIIKHKLIEYNCSECKIHPIWQNKTLVLILDHINGIYNDHRLENLRFLCPNCNSQTSTFAGKNCNKSIKNIRLKILCIGGCGKITKGYSKKGMCSSCSGKQQIRNNGKLKKPKIQWPSKEELEKRIWSTPTSDLAKELGVSDVAIAKHCKRLGINKPPRGYWQKLYINSHNVRE